MRHDAFAGNNREYRTFLGFLALVSVALLVVSGISLDNPRTQTPPHVVALAAENARRSQQQQRTTPPPSSSQRPIRREFKNGDPVLPSTRKENPITTSSAAHAIPREEDDDEEEETFLPGTLNLTRIETLQQCYVPSSLRLPEQQGCTISEKYKVIFFMTPKAGSSTGRHVVREDFGGSDYSWHCDLSKREGINASEWIQMAVFRSPTSRAFASYEEMFVRRLENQHIPPPFARFMKPFRGFKYPEYKAMFDDPVGISTLTRAYEIFMEDWDGKTYFDMHLAPQVLYNVRASPSTPGRHNANHLGVVFDTHKMEESFRDLARRVRLSHVPRVIKGRAYPRRMNVTDVSPRAFQKMCRTYAIDYCCLNYALPDKCAGGEVPRGEAVRCRWKSHNGERLIEPVFV